MRKRGERILGPYEDRAGWRVIEVDASGSRSSIVFPTEAKAHRYVDMMQAQISTEAHTTESALAEYLVHLEENGTKKLSRHVTEWSIKLLFPEPALLSMLSTKRCQALYDELRKRPTKRTGKPASVDTHRNARNRASCFLSWCVAKGWLAENPIKGKVRGVGKRRPRGRSLGKEGNEVRVSTMRLWYAKALELARQGDEGATAALMALVLGMRAGEIVSRKVGDVDEDRAAGDLIWIPCAKTAAGRRTLEVPDELSTLLARQIANREREAYLFECPGKAHAGKPHTNQWPLRQVRRICELAGVPRVTAQAMRGACATISTDRGMAPHMVAATLGHESFTTMTAKHYAAPGSAAAGALRRGWAVLDGGAAAAK